MVWSNLPNQGVTAGIVQHRGVGRIGVQGCKTSPKRCCWDDFGCDRAGDVMSKPLCKGGPRPHPTDLGIHLKISTQYSRILKESWFFHPSMAQLTTPCYLSCEWPIISGEKWGENSFFRRIRKCQGSLPRSGCYTPVIAFCYCKGFSRRDCLLYRASALRCIFTTRTDLASLFFPKFYDNKMQLNECDHFWSWSPSQNTNHN